MSDKPFDQDQPETDPADAEHTHGPAGDTPTGTEAGVVEADEPDAG